jgi:hypothetical protein
MTPLFRSYFIGGFECSTHRRLDGRRLDLVHGTRHDAFAIHDYQALQRHGIATVRDGLRWHRIECRPGRYDWSSFLPQLHAARQAGTQPIWDICHYGLPDDIDIWSAQFVERFARFAGAVAALVRDEYPHVPFYCPINEISFWAWCGGDEGDINPCVRGRGNELKLQLVRAATAGIAAIRDADPRARIVTVDPVIHVVPQTEADRHAAEASRLAQFDAWDMLAGRRLPELGGRPDNLDVVGVNFYPHNQWYLNGRMIPRGEPDYRPFRQILAEVWQRYGRPVFVAETGAEAERRVPWLRYVCDEVAAALEQGVPVVGLCLYPITDYPGWDNDRHCPTGLLGYADDDGRRPEYADLADEIARQQPRLSRLLAASASVLEGMSPQGCMRL